MIVSSLEQYLVLIPNTMTLEKDGVYFYVEKSLYDNLVLLKNHYDFERIGELIGKDNNLEIIEWLRDQLPSPLDSLAQFLRLVTKEVEDDLELCIGSLHEIFCTGLNPYGFLKTPMEMRRDIEFGRTGNVYQEMWKGIMNQFVEYDRVMELLSNPMSFNQQDTNNMGHDNYQVKDSDDYADEDGDFKMVGDILYFDDEENDEIEPLDLGEIGNTEKDEVEVNNTSDEEGQSENSEIDDLMKALNGGN